MSNVLIDKNKIDILANAISCKSGEPVTMTLDEMVEAVDGIEPNLQTKTYTVDSAGTETITADSGYDGLSKVDVVVPSADPWLEITLAFSGSGNDRMWTATPKVSVDVAEGDTAGFMADGYEKSGTDPLRFNAVPSNTTITPTESSQTVGGASYMMEGAVTVNAISSNYVGSGITRRSSSDLQAFDDVITVPAGYYAQQAEKSVGYATLATPTATKGAVSNHSVSVTPSITQPYGYTDGGTKTGTAVTVSASELVSGSQTITDNGTTDVTNLASVTVAIPFVTYYTGSSTPSSSLGSNGDIYLKTV